MSAIIKTEEHQLLQAAQDYNALNLSMAASIVWIVHDILLTLPQEIESVWRTKFTYHKILYIITRYFGLASLIVNFVGSSSPSPSFLFCRHWLWFIGFGPAVSNATGELLFMIRIYAAYGRSRSILAVLTVLFLVETSFSWIITGLNLHATSIVQRSPGYPLPGCVADHTPSRLVKADIASWVVASSVAVCLFVLIMIYFVRTVRRSSPDGCTNNFHLLTSKHLTPLIVLFIRDGMAYFILVTTAMIINLFMTCVLSNRPLSQIGTGFLIATYAIASSRLYLNLRSSGTLGDRSLPTVEEDIQFRTSTLRSTASGLGGLSGINFD